MLELPESYSIAKQLNQAIAGKTIKKAEANHSPHKLTWYAGDAQSYANLLSGKTISSVTNQSGMVEITSGDALIVLSDGVNIRYLTPGEKPPVKHQLHLEFLDGSSLFCSVQMYGGILAFTEGEYDSEYYSAACQNPSPLTDEFDFKYFNSLLKSDAQRLSAKAFLATEQRIPGLGNGVLQDILFNACINPQTKMNALSDDEIKTLYHSVKKTLAQMAKQGGRDTEKDIFGQNGGYQTLLSKNTYGAPCPACGGEIIKKAYMGGSVYFCPQCQKQK